MLIWHNCTLPTTIKTSCAYSKTKVAWSNHSKWLPNYHTRTHHCSTHLLVWVHFILILPKHISIKRVSLFIHRRFAPPSRVVAKWCTRRNGGIQARNFQGRVWRRWSISLHVDQPRWRSTLSHSKRFPQLCTQLTRLDVFHFWLKLLALIVQLTQPTQLWFFLMFEKSIVEDLSESIQLLSCPFFWWHNFA